MPVFGKDVTIITSVGDLARVISGRLVGMVTAQSTPPLALLPNFDSATLPQM